MFEEMKLASPHCRRRLVQRYLSEPRMTRNRGLHLFTDGPSFVTKKDAVSIFQLSHVQGHLSHLSDISYDNRLACFRTQLLFDLKVVKRWRCWRWSAEGEWYFR